MSKLRPTKIMLFTSQLVCGIQNSLKLLRSLLSKDREKGIPGRGIGMDKVPR